MIDIELSDIVRQEVLKKALITAYLIEDKGTKNDPVTVFHLDIDSAAVQAIRESTQAYLKDVLKLMKEIRDENEQKMKERKEDDSLIPDYNPDHSQSLFQIQRETVAAETFNTLTLYLSSLKSAIPFKKEQIKENKLKAWVFRFEFEKKGAIKQIYFFQKFQASKMLDAKKISFFQQGDVFKLLDHYMLTINDEMDFLLYEGTFVVTKMVAFEKAFGYEAFYKENAADLVTSLEKDIFPDLDYRVKFSSPEGLKSTMGKIQKSTRIAHKLYSAKKNGYFKKIKFEKLEKLSQHYRMDLALDAEKKEWTIEDDSNLFIVSQILNDDYGISQLTDIEYLALMKERLQRPKLKPPKPKSAKSESDVAATDHKVGP